MRQVLSLVILASLFGCAASSEPAAPTVVAAAAPASAASGTAPKQICSRETPIGSNRPVMVCRDVDGADSQANERAAGDLSRQTGLTTQMIGRAGH